MFAELYRLQVDYWHDVDHNYGRNAKQFYTADGVFAFRGKRLNGPAEIGAFYAWREQRGDRTARHLIANCRLSRLTGKRAEFECVLSIYAGDGVPVLQAQAPALIMDSVAQCVRELDAWRFESHVLTTIFQGDAKLSLPAQAELPDSQGGRNALKCL